MDKLLDSFETVFGNGFLEYFRKQEKKHNYFKLNDYKKVIQKFVEDEQRERVNYYSGKHVHFTRFLLISIEKFQNNGRSIDFTELDHKGKLIWQLEHIIPQSNFKKEDSDKNKLGNLTLLYRDTNVKISDKTFVEKKKVLLDKVESKFYINEVFRRDSFEKSDIENRSIDLIKEFNEILGNSFDKYCKKVLFKGVAESKSDNVSFSISKISSNLLTTVIAPFQGFLNTNSINSNVSVFSNKTNQIILESLKSISKPLSNITLPKIDYSSILEPIRKQLSSLLSVYNFKNIGDILKNIDFNDYQKQLDEENKRKIAKCLHFDIYPPLLFLDEFAPISDVTNQTEADFYLYTHLEYLDEQRGRDVYDFIPKSLKTYKEIVQLEYLESLKMYKMMVIFCLERIEFLLSQIQIQEQKIHFSELKTSQKSFRNFVNASNNDDFLNKLVSQITFLSEYHEKGYIEVNLFKKFKEIESVYSEGNLPLNRNIFMHGLVDERNVSFLLVQKAIMAYAFFEELYRLKTTNKKNLRSKLFKRRGISRKKKTRFSFKKGGRIYIYE